MGTSVELYELYDTDTANQVGVYETREAALAVVRSSLRAYGPRAVEGLALGCEDVSGDTVVLAAGAALAVLAEEDASRANAADGVPAASVRARS